MPPIANMRDKGRDKGTKCCYHAARAQNLSMLRQNPLWFFLKNVADPRSVQNRSMVALHAR